jgi:hypothetical protein
MSYKSAEGLLDIAPTYKVSHSNLISYHDCIGSPGNVFLWNLLIRF